MTMKSNDDNFGRLVRAGLIVLLGAMASYLALGLPVFRDALQVYFAIDLPHLGMLFSLGLLPAAAGTLLAGIMLDGADPVRFLRVGFLGCALGMALASVGWHFHVMLVAVLAVGTFSAILTLVVQTYVVRVFPHHQRRALSLQMAVGGLVSMLCPLLAEGLLHVHRINSSVRFGLLLHVPFAVLAVMFLAGAVWLRRKEHEGAPLSIGVVPGQTSERERRFARLSPRATGLVLLLILHGTSDTALALWLPRVMDSASFTVKGWPPGVVLAGAAFAYMVSRTLLGFAPEQRGWRLGMVAPGPMGGGLFILGLMSRSALLLGVCYILGALLWSCEYPVFLARAAREEPRRFGTIMALSSVGISLGAFGLTMAMGWTGQRLGDPRMWMVLLAPACGLVLVGMGGAAWLMRFGRAGPATGSP